MDDDVVADIFRAEHEQAVEVEISLRGAAAPARPLVSDRDAADCDADDGQEMTDASGDVRARPSGELLNVIRRERGQKPAGLIFLLHARKVLVDPVRAAHYEAADL